MTPESGELDELGDEELDSDERDESELRLDVELELEDDD